MPKPYCACPEPSRNPELLFQTKLGLIRGITSFNCVNLYRPSPVMSNSPGNEPETRLRDSETGVRGNKCYICRAKKIADPVLSFVVPFVGGSVNDFERLFKFHLLRNQSFPRTAQPRGCHILGFWQTMNVFKDVGG